MKRFQLHVLNRRLFSEARDPNKFVKCVKSYGRFISPFETHPQTFSGFWEEIVYKLSNKLGKLNIPDNVRKSFYMKSTLDPNFQDEDLSNAKVTWMGHSSCHIQVDGKFILTDPMWSQRAFPFQLMGPKREFGPPIEVEDLKIDIVLLSHTHFDHLDSNTARRIGDRALWIVPLGVASVLKGMGVTNVVELDWWDTYHFPLSDSAEGVKRTLPIVFTPAKHWTARTPFDKNMCLWGSFAILGNNARIYFGGDTAYCDVFRTIGEEYGPFDMSLLPIGCYLPRELMENIHCDPAEALQIHKDLRSRQSMGIHWGTFHLADDEDVEAAFELARVRQLSGISKNVIFTAGHGETIRVGDRPKFDFATMWPEEAASYVEQKYTRFARRRQLKVLREMKRARRQQLRSRLRSRLWFRQPISTHQSANVASSTASASTTGSTRHVRIHGISSAAKALFTARGGVSFPSKVPVTLYPNLRSRAKFVFQQRVPSSLASIRSKFPFRINSVKLPGSLLNLKSKIPMRVNSLRARFFQRRKNAEEKQRYD